jgi:hypothetical protein
MGIVRLAKTQPAAGTKTIQGVEKPLRALFCPSSRGLSNLFCGVWSLFVWCFRPILDYRLSDNDFFNRLGRF